MRDVRTQYFLLYAMLGAVLPYASVFFRHAGLSAAQVGYAFAIWSGGAILTPVIVTYVADRLMDARRLIALSLALSGASLIALGFVHGVWMILAVWTVHCFTVLAAMPVLDGVCFSVQRRREARGERAPAYHHVRVWGTIGFIVPSLLLFAFLYRGMPIRGALMSGAVFAAVAAVQALRIRDCGPPGEAPVDNGDGRDDADADSDMPTFAAARALLQPGLRVFCAAMLLVQVATAMHGAFYPIYLTERAGVAAKWVGLIANVGVVAEIFFMLATGWLTRVLGVRGLFLAGIVGVAVRLGLLALFVNAPVAIATQLFHGLHIVAVFVLPQTLVDRFADDRCRHSMQGVFGMFTGAGRVGGNLLAGWLWTRGSLEGVMGVGALLALGAAMMVIFGLRRLPDGLEVDDVRRRDGDDACASASSSVPATTAEASAA